VIRQQFDNPNSWLPGPNQLTINYQPASILRAFAVINVQNGQAEFWRVVDASTQRFSLCRCSLERLRNNSKWWLWTHSVDHSDLRNNHQSAAGWRAEFIVPGLPVGRRVLSSPPASTPVQSATEFRTAVGQHHREWRRKGAHRRPPAQALADPQRFADSWPWCRPLRKPFLLRADHWNEWANQFFVTVKGQKPRSSIWMIHRIVTQVGQWRIGRSRTVLARRMISTFTKCTSCDGD